MISIQTCYPHTPNNTGPATNRSAKLDMLFAKKVTAPALVLYSDRLTKFGGCRSTMDMTLMRLSLV